MNQSSYSSHLRTLETHHRPPPCSHRVGKGDTTVDFAGALIGGGRRIRDEFESYLATIPRNDLAVVGWNEPLTIRHLAKRERRVSKSTVSFNNVAFVRGEQKTALLHNLLHFLPDEHAALRRMDRAAVARFRLTRMIVRRAAAWADRLLVPTQYMATYVDDAAPHLSDRLEVISAPLSPPERGLESPLASNEYLLSTLLFAVQTAAGYATSADGSPPLPPEVLSSSSVDDNYIRRCA